MCLEKFLSEFLKTKHEKPSYNFMSANSFSQYRGADKSLARPGMKKL